MLRRRLRVAVGSYVTYRRTQCAESELRSSDRELSGGGGGGGWNSASQNSLERLVEADGGGAVEDDVDVLGQHTLIFFAQIQLRLREVTVHSDDLLGEARLLLLKSFKELSTSGTPELQFNQSQVQPYAPELAAFAVLHSEAMIPCRTEMWKNLGEPAPPSRPP